MANLDHLDLMAKMAVRAKQAEMEPQENEV